MRAQKEGVIINVSSVGGRITFPFSTLYHSTKFAVEGMTESLQYEVNPLGIRTKLVEPGGYKTDFVSRSMSFYGTAGITDYEVPLGKFGAMLEHWPLNENIEEVGEAIFLAATDGTEKLRYPIGHDAAQTLEARGKMDDVEFKKMMASQTGVA
jgi:NAD(P)-dependent dehydrogenase (short-subunit alcohol dehydrogenase family)